MTTYTAIPDSDIDPESPGTTTLFTRLRDNPLAVAEGDATAPSIIGLDPIGEVVVSSPVAGVDFQNGVGGIVFDSTYDAYKIALINVVPATDAVSLYGRVYVGGVLQTGASAYDYSGATQAEMEFAASIGSASGEGLDGEIYVNGITSSTQFKRFTATATYTLSTGFSTGGTRGGQYRSSASAIDGVRLYFSAGNIESGTFRLYGVRK